MDKRLLNKFVSNSCTSEEVDIFFDWAKKSRIGNINDGFLFREYWDKIPVSSNPDKEVASRRLDRVHHTINLNQSSQDRRGGNRFLKEKKYRFLQIVSKAAVILLIPVITILIYTQFFKPVAYVQSEIVAKLEVASPMGSRTHMDLPDGTKVWLNHGSKLIYPQRFNGKVRVVQLVGEGYFKVVSNKSKPFIVKAKGIAVKAVGTSFNIKAYEDDTDVETTLETGKVVVLKNKTGNQTEICKMDPGEHFAFNETTNEYSVKKVESAKYVAWKDGKLVFKDDHLDEVAERLSRWYNVKITLNNTELNSLTYTATFIDETLDQILDMMEVVTPISHTVSARQKLQDGTFSKKEILIYKKGGN